MKTACEMELEFRDETTARNIARALELDNQGYVKTRVEGNILHVSSESDSIMELRNTLDDFLACVTVAQKSLEGAE